MKNRKIKTFMLGSVLALSGALGLNSCDNANGTGDSKPTTSDMVNPIEYQKWTYCGHVLDSVLEVSGYNKYNQEYENLSFHGDTSVKKDYERLDNLSYKYTFGGTIYNQVVTSGAKIIDKYCGEIASELGKYNIIFNPEFTNYPDNYFDIKRGVFSGKYALCFVRPTEAGADYIYCEGFYNFAEEISRIIDKSGCGINQKNDIKAKINNMIHKMALELEANRISIEKNYLAYLPSNEFSENDCGKRKMFRSENGQFDYKNNYNNLNQIETNGWVKSAKSPADKQTTDSLYKEIARKEQLIEDYKDLRIAVYNMADSIANAMTRQKFQGR